MGQIYSGIVGIEPPEFKSGETWNDYEKRQVEYVETIKDQARILGNFSRYSGEEVYFPQGDGHARYIVISIKPLQLIHLPVGDAWHFPYIERLTAKDITTKIDQQRAIREIFSKKE